MREMRLHIGECGVPESMKMLLTSHLHGSIHVKEGKRARKEGGSVRIKARGTQVIGSSGGREEGRRHGGWLCAEISARHCLRVG